LFKNNNFGNWNHIYSILIFLRLLQFSSSKNHLSTTPKIYPAGQMNMSRDSLVGIMTNFELYDLGSISVGLRDFSLLNSTQTASGAHPASYTSGAA
jgi:hypothetical protein